ncbi:MAG: acetylglutamate kinase [Bacteroidota bacterium]|nr:acetylglutamate kinase [Bacteroidota bacterium]
MNQVKVIKIGGNVVDNPALLHDFLENFSKIQGRKVLVHGGGVMASQMQKELGMVPEMVEGRRVTDADTLRIVTMVYAGWCNKQIVSMLQGFGCNALGFSGADGNLIRSEKRPPVEMAGRVVDFGFVGDVRMVNTDLLETILDAGMVPVVCAITHDCEGHLLNTNADTVASSLAIALAGAESVELVYCFEKDGVLYDKDDDDTVIPSLTREDFAELKAEGRVAAGMIPKLENSFAAISAGVSSVVIKHAANILENYGTVLK